MKDIPQWQQDLVLNRMERGLQDTNRLLDWDLVCKTVMADGRKTKSGIKELPLRRNPEFVKIMKALKAEK